MVRLLNYRQGFRKKLVDVVVVTVLIIGKVILIKVFFLRRKIRK
jgi:hypothetical protein